MPERGSGADANCFEVIGPFLERMAGSGTPYQVLGSVSMLPFLAGPPAVDVAARRVVPPERLQLSTTRDNGSRRDLDVLVLSTRADLVARVRAIAADTIGTALETSVFALRPLSQLREQRARPLLSACRVFLGDRYAEEDEHGRITRLQRALFPFAVEVDTGSLDTWHVDVGGPVAMPVQRPGSLIAGYLTRSISGLRPKDLPKVDRLARALHLSAPGEIEWLTSGAGAPLLHLARLIHSLRGPASGETVGPLTLTPCPRRALRELDAFLLRDAPAATREVVLAASIVKASALHRLEGSERLVGFWQRRGFEDVVRGIIHNEPGPRGT